MLRSFRRQTSSLEGIVALVREFLAAERLPEDSAFELELVLEELFTNLVKYGRGARGDVEIAIERAGGDVILRLREFDAEPFDPTGLPQVDVQRPIDERRPGGLGIHLVRKISRDFRYHYDDRVGTTTVELRTSS